MLHLVSSDDGHTRNQQVGELTSVKATSNSEREFAPLVAAYNEYFGVSRASSASQLTRAHRLRYQVYCVENDFESQADNPDGLERDAFDDRAVHSLLFHRPSGEVIGTVRLVLPDGDASQGSFPMLGLCDHPALSDPSRFPIGRAAEISRFAVSKDFRRRRGEERYPDVECAAERARRLNEERRLLPYLTLGLMRGLVEMSAANGVDHWCMVAEPSLLRLLAKLGVRFEPLGGLVRHHGLRQPCHANITRLLSGVHADRPDVWEVITAGGRLWPLPAEAPIRSYVRYG